MGNSNRAHKRARENKMNEELQKHLQETSEGLYDDEASNASFKQEDIQKALQDSLKTAPNQPSSSSNTPPPPFGINAVPLPKRRRSTSARGSKREGDMPEEVPRRIRAKSRPPETITEEIKRGRKPDTEEVKQAKAEAKAKAKAEAKAEAKAKTKK